MGAALRWRPAEDISMKESLLTLTLAFAAITFSLAVRAQAQTVTFLAQFNGENGNGPFGSVIQATDGNFYGTTAAGGAHDKGQVFRMTPSGKISTIYSFCSQSNCVDGALPSTAPILGSDGNLYGAVAYGGSDSAPNAQPGSGAIYKLTLGGQIEILYTFCSSGLPCVDGQSPNRITQASDGTFYGTTPVGGTLNEGTIFRITPGGQFKLLHTFCSQANCGDGQSPRFPPIQGRDGNFYGTAGGVFYELTSSGTYEVLHTFCIEGACASGSGPTTVVQGAKGNFYGTTVFGGIENNGTVFEITSTNQYHVLHRFNRTDGNGALFGLTAANDGNLYGVLLDGGSNIGGTAFEVTPAGRYTTLYSFDAKQGSTPIGPLFQGTDGSFYGTTEFGSNSLFGSVFRLSNGLSPYVEPVPARGNVGERILILGNGLSGTSSVTFNDVAAKFKVQKDTLITAWVPAGATTGTVSVVTPGGTLKSNPQFVVTK